METFIPLLLILLFGLLFAEFFKRIHLPFVTGLILAGLIIGPSGLNILQLDHTITFFGLIGLIFLMFLGGLEIQFDSFRQNFKEDFVIVILNSTIPFLVGLAIALQFGYSFDAALLLGLSFISSSIAIIIPTLESNGLMKSTLGKLVTSATIIQDLASLLLISLVLRDPNAPDDGMSLAVEAIILIAAIIILRFVIPRIQTWYRQNTNEQDFFETELRFVIISLIATVVIFEILGIHAIVAGFVVGMFVGDSINEVITNKIRTISYGLFVPVFFVTLGVDLNLDILGSIETLAFTLLVVSGLFLSKTISGFIAGKILKFDDRRSLLLGVATTPQLSTTLAAVFTAKELGIFDDQITTAMVILSVFTTIASPVLVSRLSEKLPNVT